MILEQALRMGYLYFGGSIVFRPIQATVADGLLVSCWRNSPQARASFYNQQVVTPDSHVRFVARKDPYDQVWIVEKNIMGEEDGEDWAVLSVGMTALHIDPVTYEGEYGRTIISPRFQGKGYAIETEYTLLMVAFEFFQLRRLWLDAFVSNEPILALHDKTGWERAGVDVVGHTNPRGPVQHMTYDRPTWAVQRVKFAERCLKDSVLPTWEP